MREIKFRAWWADCFSELVDGQYKKAWKLSPVHSIHIGKNTAMVTGGLCHSVRSVLIGEECIIEQFTGLRDKSGRDIYDGDILGDPIGLIVHWCGRSNGWQLQYPQTRGCACYHCEGDCEISDWKLKDVEVVGNIHENPELVD